MSEKWYRFWFIRTSKKKCVGGGRRKSLFFDGVKSIYSPFLRFPRAHKTVLVLKVILWVNSRGLRVNFMVSSFLASFRANNSTIRRPFIIKRKFLSFTFFVCLTQYLTWEWLLILTLSLPFLFEEQKATQKLILKQRKILFPFIITCLICFYLYCFSYLSGLFVWYYRRLVHYATIFMNFIHHCL